MKKLSLDIGEFHNSFNETVDPNEKAIEYAAL